MQSLCVCVCVCVCTNPISRRHTLRAFRVAGRETADARDDALVIGASRAHYNEPVKRGFQPNATQRYEMLF